MAKDLGPAEALSGPARRAAEAAAVIGPELALDLLALVNGGDEGIDTLLESDVLSETSPGTAAFASARMRDAVYAAIPWTRRRALHRRVAEAFESRRGPAAQLAEHWVAGGEVERARRTLLEAAERARQSHGHQDAAQSLRRALDLWTPGEAEAERLAALEHLGDAAQAAGLLADAMRAWREVAESGDQAVRARALRKIANLHELSCQWGQAIEARQDAMSAFEAAGEPAEAATEGVTAAIRLRLSARHAAGLEVLARAEADAAAAGREDLKVRVAALKGNLLARLGRTGEGIPAIRDALKAALALDSPALAGEVYQRLADAIERTSDFRRGVATNLDGIAFCEERDAAAGIMACLGCMSWILIRSGEWEDAVAASRRMLESPAVNPAARCMALCFTGLVHVLRGELRKGEPMLLEADAAARRLEHALAEFICRWGLAMREAIAGDMEAAADRCRGILARWRMTDERHASMPILRWSASCFAHVRDREGLRHCADAFSDAAATFGHAEPLSGLAHVLGETAWLDGDLPRAVEQFERAAALIEDMQLPRERVESRLRAASACAAAGRREQAVAHAREAARGAERLGARPLFEQAAQQLRALGEPLAGAIGPRGARRAATGGLTPRQLQILEEISKGLTDKEIGRSLRLSPRTVEMHVAHALAALDCRSRAEAVRKAAELGVLGRRAP